METGTQGQRLPSVWPAYLVSVDLIWFYITITYNLPVYFTDISNYYLVITECV